MTEFLQEEEKSCYALCFRIFSIASKSNAHELRRNRVFLHKPRKNSQDRTPGAVGTNSGRA
jgi:hypothetical protein